MKKFDIKTLKIMFVSGANNLYNHHFEVDKLNVFPVPDGDTGTNMNLTMMNGIKELNGKEYDNIKSFATTFSHGLMMGARGNSGVILSQIFRGFLQVLKTKDFKNDVISSQDIIKAWKSAQEHAYRAVMKPVEGTILTVVKDGVNFISQLKWEEDNILLVFEKLLEGMRYSLKRTPDLLPILKKVGVVDSGGAGLVYIIEGMVYGLKYNKAIAPKKRLNKNDNDIKLEMVLNQENFGYCTEVIIQLNKVSRLDFNLNKTRNDLESMDGQSIVVVADEDLIKVHVHTLKPGHVLNYFQEFGEILKVKIENMTEQAKAHTQTIKPERKLVNEFALIAAINGRGVENFFREELKVNNVILYTSGKTPATDDFLKAIENVDAKNVYILPNDSNFTLAAQQAIKLEKKSKVYLIPTTNIGQGMRVALKFSTELTPKENYKTMLNEIKNVAFSYITIADRNVEIDSVKIEKGHYFASATFRKDPKSKQIVVSSEDFKNVIKHLFNKLIWSNAEIITIFKGKGATKDQVNYITKVLDEDYDIEYEFIDGEQEVYNFLFVVE